MINLIICILRITTTTRSTWIIRNTRITMIIIFITSIRIIMNTVNIEGEQYQLGKTKVFIKAPESVSLKLF